jgi:hypothetical protein
VSHDYEEVEEEEDVEVTLPREPLYWVRVGFVFREAQRSDFKKPTAALFVSPKPEVVPLGGTEWRLG